MSGFPQPTLNPILAGTHNFANANGISTNIGAGLASADGRPNLNISRSVSLPANVSVTNSVTLTNATGLTFAGTTLTTWQVTAVLRFTAPTPAGDLKIGFSVPGGASYHISGARVDATGATVLIDDQGTVVSVQGAGATLRCVVVTATISFGLASGSVTVQFAQNTANATPTILTTPSSLQYQQSSEFTSWGNGQRFRVAMLGDSITDGSTLSTYNTQPWPTFFRRYLAGILGLPDGGPGFRSAVESDYAGSAWVRTGAWTNAKPGDNTLAYNKAPGSRLLFSSDNTATLTYTKPPGEAALLRAELLYIDGPSSADMQVSFDGGPFIAMGLPTTQNNLVRTFSIAGQFASTIAFRNNQAGGTMYPVGCAFYDGLSGLVYDSYAIGGQTAQENIVGTNGADACYIPANFYVPRLTFIEFGANEMIFGNGGTGAQANALTNYSANLTALATRFSAFGDVVFLFGPRPQLGGAFVNLPLYGNIELQARTVAANMNLPIVDFSEAWGDWSIPNAAGFMFDAYHPTPAGARNIASRISAAITAAIC